MSTETEEMTETQLAAQPSAALPVVQDNDADLPVPWEELKQNAAAVNLSPIEKAAIILSAIGPENAADFLKDMSEAALTRTAIAISSLDRISPEVLDTVIAEFLLSIGTDEEISGGRSTARKLLSTVLDDKTIEKIMFDVEGGDSRAAWKKLNDVGTATLAAFIAAEHPQTVAVIMSELRPEKAAGVLERLDQELAQQTVLRLSRVPSLDHHVAEMVERVITRDFLSAIHRTLRARKPADLIAGLMNNLTSDTREQYLEFLADERPQLQAEVLKTMFTFNDIRHRVEPRDVAIIVKEMDEPLLLVALKWGQAQKSTTVDFILENLSKRLTERLVEDLDAQPDTTQRDGEAAHQDLVRKIQEMSKSGQIQLVEDDNGDE